jgi:site-specific DNA-cytosine methylase
MGAPEVDGGFYMAWPASVACTLNAAFADKQGLEDQHALSGASLFVPHAIHGTQDPDVLRDMAHTLGRNNGAENAVFSIMPMNSGKDYKAREVEVAQPIMTTQVGGNQGGDYVVQQAVRRLTPRECERLQGFRDDFTAIPWRGKDADECPDGPRYKALGNSMAVPVMAWIGRRIDQVDAILKTDVIA